MRPEAAHSHQGQGRDRSSNRPDRFVHPMPPTDQITLAVRGGHRLNTRLTSPIFTRARTMPMVRTNYPILCFCSAKTCSMQERTADFLALAWRVGCGIGLPLGF